jgi:hypothetical protein
MSGEYIYVFVKVVLQLNLINKPSKCPYKKQVKVISGLGNDIRNLSFYRTELSGRLGQLIPETSFHVKMLG